MLTNGALMFDPLCVVATIQPRPEHFEAARNAIAGIVSETLEEPGCQMFRLLEGDDGYLRLYEEWDDEAALQAHYNQSYTKAVFASYENWLAEPVEVIRLRRIS